MTLKPYMAMELKKVGQRKEEALNQLCDAILETIDSKGNSGESEFEVYAVVLSGLEIRFFEYHSDQSNLDEECIPHFRGCVSLTEDYFINGVHQVVLHNKPQDLENLFFDSGRLRKETSVREEAKAYKTPCFFNLNKHQEEIHFLFQHMEKNKPRSSW